MKNRTIVYISCLYITMTIESISIVYNLRIAETTKRQIPSHEGVAESIKGPYITALTPFDQYRRFHIDAHENFAGALGTFIYIQPSFYCKVDGAVAHASATALGIHESRTQTDDILCSAGYSFNVSDWARMTFSGMLGIPTHADRILNEVQFGTGHVGLGVQWDGSFWYSASQQHSIRPAARLIHFFPRNTQATLDHVFRQFRLHIGNAADLFLAHHSKFGHHHVEIGFDQTFLFGATIKPKLDIITQQINVIRSSFYGVYIYHFSIHDHPSAAIIGLSYGFDERPKCFGCKNIITVWGSWGINF